MRNIKYIVIHHSATTRDIPLQQSVTSFSNNHKVRLSQPVSKETWLYVAYHYVVAWNWTWEKTRWFEEIGYHAGLRSVNKTSIGICFTGNFDIETPSQKQLESWRQILATLKKLYPNAKVIGHRDVEWVTKSCPGKNFNILSLISDYKSEKMKKLYAILIDSIPYMINKENALNLQKQLIESWYWV